MDIKERIKALRTHLGYKSDKDFAEFLGISPNTISTWYARGNADWDLIIANCESVDANWLLTGDGEMIKGQKKKPETDGSGKGEDPGWREIALAHKEAWAAKEEALSLYRKMETQGSGSKEDLVVVAVEAAKAAVDRLATGYVSKQTFSDQHLDTLVWRQWCMEEFALLRNITVEKVQHEWGKRQASARRVAQKSTTGFDGPMHRDDR